MKLSSAVIVAVATAQNDEKKVPPRHPLQRLNRLTEFSAEIMITHFDWLKSQPSWINKFAADIYQSCLFLVTHLSLYKFNCNIMYMNRKCFGPI